MGWFGWGSSDNNPASDSLPEMDLSGATGSYQHSPAPEMSSPQFTDFPGSSYGNQVSSSNADQELQQIIAIEQQRAAFHSQVRNLTDLCWDMCVEKPTNRFDSRTETCICNCVDRFIDTTLTITNRFAQMLQQSGGF